MLNIRKRVLGQDSDTATMWPQLEAIPEYLQVFGIIGMCLQPAWLPGDILRAFPDFLLEEAYKFGFFLYGKRLFPFKCLLHAYYVHRVAC